MSSYEFARNRDFCTSSINHFYIASINSINLHLC
jgi:hypothetical protein